MKWLRFKEVQIDFPFIRLICTDENNKRYIVHFPKDILELLSDVFGFLFWILATYAILSSLIRIL